MRIAVAGGTGTVGQYVVEAAEGTSHESVVLTRSEGVDVRTGVGLAEALTGVGAIIDVTNAPGMEYDQAGPFFTDVARSLQRVGEEKGVGHIVTLSIVGIDHTSFGYYTAKRDQEDAAAAGNVPHTIMRATQPYEFPAQMLAMSRQGGAMGMVFDARIQPIAARSIGAVLLEIATATPVGRAPDLAGPDQWELIDLARRFVESRGAAISVEVDHQLVPDLRPGGLLPGPDARIEGPTFEEWLSTDDAARLQF